MRCRINDVDVHYIEHGEGQPVLVLHGAGVDHREPEACFEPTPDAHGGLRRIYPDLPGMGRTPAPAAMDSADDVLDLLLGFIEELAGQQPARIVGHSAGAYYGYGFAARRPEHVAGLALVCPLLPSVRDVPEYRPVVAANDLGDEQFRDYFVVQTPAKLERVRPRRSTRSRSRRAGARPHHHRFPRPRSDPGRGHGTRRNLEAASGVSPLI